MYRGDLLAMFLFSRSSSAGRSEILKYILILTYGTYIKVRYYVLMLQ